HRFPSRDGPVHPADRRGLCLPLLDHRHRADRRRPAGDDAPVPVAAAAALSPGGQSGLQRRGEDPTDRVLLGAQASGHPRPRGAPCARQIRVDVASLYLVRGVLPARAATQPPLAFSPGLRPLAGWALWPRRSRRFSPLWWAPLVVVAAVAGYGGHIVLHRLQ